jgi:hypothetical protein
MERHHLPCYPWGMVIGLNELEAISTNDRSNALMRAFGGLVLGRQTHHSITASDGSSQ